jgi:hypothetical protein
VDDILGAGFMDSDGDDDVCCYSFLINFGFWLSSITR